MINPSNYFVVGDPNPNCYNLGQELDSPIIHNDVKFSFLGKGKVIRIEELRGGFPSSHISYFYVIKHGE